MTDNLGASLSLMRTEQFKITHLTHQKITNNFGEN